MDIKDILEMKRDSAQAEFDGMVKDALKNVIIHSTGVEGIIIIKKDLDKDRIRTLLDDCKKGIRSQYINPLKPYMTPDTYTEVNEFLRDEIAESIKILCLMYDDRHKFLDIVKTLKDILGGEDDED